MLLHLFFELSAIQQNSVSLRVCLNIESRKRAMQLFWILARAVQTNLDKVFLGGMPVLFVGGFVVCAINPL